MPTNTSQPEKIPSIFFTHHKCASTWLWHVLSKYSNDFALSLFGTNLSKVSPPENQSFDILLFVNSDYNFCAESCKHWLDSSFLPALHIIRNPLDIVVSAYYSHLYSHSLDRWPKLADQRGVLRNLDKKAGMVATYNFLERIDFDDGAVGPLFALQHWNFKDTRIKTLRMEDIVSDHKSFQSELQSLLAVDSTDIIQQFAFENLSGGRSKGVIDNQHHFRSGKPHQWLHEMDSSLAETIYHKYKAIIDSYYPEVELLLKNK
jgi:hypothetical protein